MKIPVIDLGECVDCEACLELCPKVFRKNDAGYIEAIELGEYPEEELRRSLRIARASVLRGKRFKKGGD
jgi:ferredoxin